jgi:hypothetical protein
LANWKSEGGEQKEAQFQLERRYVNTFLKMLFYTHALRRFDKPAEGRRNDNLLILWANEAQRFVSAAEKKRAKRPNSDSMK